MNSPQYKDFNVFREVSCQGRLRVCLENSDRSSENIFLAFQPLLTSSRRSTRKFRSFKFNKTRFQVWVVVYTVWFLILFLAQRLQISRVNFRVQILVHLSLCHFETVLSVCFYCYLFSFFYFKVIINSCKNWISQKLISISKI